MYSSNEQHLQKEITERLLHYLLCFDKILIHSSDPLRSEIVFNVLNNNALLISDGSINFVFSSSVLDINRNYKSYIARKIQGYGQNQYSELDVTSLTQKHMNDEYYEKVIELLNKSPCLIHRMKSGEEIFRELIRDDLNKGEFITMHSDYLDTSEINLLDLTLYQLLHLKIDGKGSIYDTSEIDGFIKSWHDNVLAGIPFSRHTITTQLNNMANKNSKRKSITPEIRTRLVDAIEYRLSMLYSKTSCADHYLLEFESVKEWCSLYSWHFVQSFLKNIANQTVHLTQDKIQKIRSDKTWNDFKEAFAVSMCDLHMKINFSGSLAQRNLKFANEGYEFIISKLNLGERFSPLKKILMEGK
jgi:hypothetical protein